MLLKPGGLPVSVMMGYKCRGGTQEKVFVMLAARVENGSKKITF